MVDIRGLKEKNDLGGNCLDNFLAGFVMFIVIKIGNVTKRS